MKWEAAGFQLDVGVISSVLDEGRRKVAYLDDAIQERECSVK